MKLKWPEVKIIEQSSAQVTLELIISKELMFFEGHFDDFPLLPGVVQIDWAIFYGRKFLSIQGEFSGMDAIKYSKPIQPETNVTLKLSYFDEKNSLKFEYEIKGRSLEKSYNLLILNNFEEMKLNLTKQFLFYLDKLLPLQNSYLD